MADTTVAVINKTEVSVDFAYSGELPDNTEVTVHIPEGETDYQDGDALYLYYCNPDTNEREYVGEGIYQGGQVTFKLYHCSEYIITSVNHGASYTEGTSVPFVGIYVLLGVTLSCGAGLLIFKAVKKKNK